MEIWEIMEIQKNCAKEAGIITRKAYEKYDAIWTDGIRITEDLAKMGEKTISEINRKMPNMLMKRQERKDIHEIAAKYGFENAKALVDYLLAYKPRKKYEKEIYKSLILEKMAGKTETEISIALEPVAAIKATLKSCREMAMEITRQIYEKYDEIWAGGIKITDELRKHGSDIINEINRKMPNMLTHRWSAPAIDQVAIERRYGFEGDVQALVDWLLEYSPRTAFLENLCDKMARQQMGLDQAENQASYETDFSEITDEVPF